MELIHRAEIQGYTLYRDEDLDGIYYVRNDEGKVAKFDLTDRTHEDTIDVLTLVDRDIRAGRVVWLMPAVVQLIADLGKEAGLYDRSNPENRSYHPAQFAFRVLEEGHINVALILYEMAAGGATFVLDLIRSRWGLSPLRRHRRQSSGLDN